MEGGESPLDVLSRAATMVQENQALSPQEDSTKQNKQTTKWKRDRRSRLPEYTRKSDPKFAEVFGQQEAISNQDLINGSGGGGGGGGGHLNGSDTPLDMSVRQRGLPPSYAQTISNPGYRSSYRPSVIQNGAPPPREELPSGISMCDPIIDEHFRRSLGDDYHVLFQNNNISKEQTTRKSQSPPKTPTATVVELMDNTGLSVDEHFAKALGDTWAKLNRKEPEIKNKENSLVST